MRFEGRLLVPGRATGSVLLLEEPLSFWGGVDAETGVLIERRHPQFGQRLTDRVLSMPSGKGSSSSSSVLAEAIRLGTAPAAIVLESVDEIVTVGALVAGEMYERWCPVVLLDRDERLALPGTVTVEADGTVTGT